MLAQNRTGGCVGGFLGIVLVAGLVLGMVWFIFGSFKDAAIYQEALTRARANEAVQEALGTPIEADWWVTGSMRQNGSMESAQIQIPIYGPRARGTLYVDGRGINNEWTFFILAVEVDGETIDLTDE